MFLNLENLYGHEFWNEHLFYVKEIFKHKHVGASITGSLACGISSFHVCRDCHRCYC